MKILALGGCGQEGKTAVRQLLRLDQTVEIKIADIDLDKAKRFEAELGSRQVSAARIDVEDRASLVRLMREADVTANFVGPYFRFGPPVLKAAIEARTSYLDIDDDYDATLECLVLHDEAAQAGITAVIGCGASPGLSNVLVKHAAEKMERADEAQILFVVSATDVEDLGASAALLHTFHMIEGTIPAFIDGKAVEVPGLSEPETVQFPRLGAQVVRYFGHPEPVTLPRYIEGLRTVKVKGGLPGINELIQMLAAVGLASSASVEVRGRSVVPQEVAMALLARLPMPPPEELPPPISEMLILVRGERDGNRVEYAYRLEEPTRMSPGTGIPAAIGMRMLAEGKIQRKGVFPPEGCVEPGPFLEELMEAGFVFSETETVTRRLALGEDVKK